MDERLSKAFQAAVDSGKMPGCGGIILDKSGKVIWKGAFGSTNVNDPAAPTFTYDTPFMIFSCTKLVVSILALQLVESGKLRLDDLAETYVPKISQIPVLEGFDEEGQPKLRAAKKKPTILNLLTHTAGFSYDFFDIPTLKWRLSTGRQPGAYMSVSEWPDFETPMLFEPGEDYCYGAGTDWLGFVLEAITGKKLADLADEKILKPLQMTRTGREYTSGIPKLDLHMRAPEGNLTAAPEVIPKINPEVWCGGGYIISTLNDFPQLLLTLLNGGEHPTLKVRILQEDTVKKYAFTDQLSQICSPDKVGLIGSSLPPVSLTGEFLPGVKKTWSTCLLVNQEANAKGRNANSGYWCGLGNLFYFVDPTAEKCAFFATNILPFLDPQALYLFDEMERAMYGHEGKKNIGEVSGNYGAWDMPATT